MKVKDIMAKEVVTVDLETKIAKVAKILFENKFHGIPVMEGGKVAGIISESDFFAKGTDNLFLPTYIDMLDEVKIHGDLPGGKEKEVEELLELKAKDIMTKDSINVSPEMEIADLIRLFREKKLSVFPVIDKEKKLVGIVTLGDVLKLIKID
jgi:CBS domain-containing protein